MDGTISFSTDGGTILFGGILLGLGFALGYSVMGWVFDKLSHGGF